VIYFSDMIKQDAELINRAKLRAQAEYVAEAGVYHAIANIKEDGFDARSDFSGALDIGTYSVTYSERDGRYLITSVGTVAGVSRTVPAEIEGLLPTALTKIIAGGNNVKLRASGSTSLVTITGDIHANNDVELRALGNGEIYIFGEVSATGIVREGSKHHQSDTRDTYVFINNLANDTADVEEGASRITFPNFDYSKYRQEAIDSGDYYSGSKTFFNETLSPGNGIVFVEGNASIRGACTVNGGIIANDIVVFGTLSQVKSGDRNIIVARERDILVGGKLETAEAIVYAKRDLRTLQAGTEVAINGILIAERDISFWNVQTNVTYTYLLTYPSDLQGAENEDLIQIISWNR
jgi:hypothetical protein